MKILENLRQFILPVKEINEHLPKKGLIYEIGSGYGSLANSIALYSKQRQVIGLDLDINKIIRSQKNFPLSNLNFVEGNAAGYKYQKCNGIVLSDFLHHLSFPIQEKVLEIIVKILSKNGRLIIKEIVLEEKIRSKLSRIWDWILYPNDKIYYRKKSIWIKTLEKYGFSIQTSSLTNWFPGSTCLFICTKK